MSVWKQQLQLTPQKQTKQRHYIYCTAYRALTDEHNTGGSNQREARKEKQLPVSEDETAGATNMTQTQRQPEQQWKSLKPKPNLTFKAATDWTCCVKTTSNSEFYGFKHVSYTWGKRSEADMAWWWAGPEGEKEGRFELSLADLGPEEENRAWFEKMSAANSSSEITRLVWAAALRTGESEKYF